MVIWKSSGARKALTFDSFHAMLDVDLDREDPLYNSVRALKMSLFTWGMGGVLAS